MAEAPNSFEQVAVCPRCGASQREGLNHASMLNSEPGKRYPYICIECMLIETEEMRRRGRVLPYVDWACNNAAAWGLDADDRPHDPRALPRVLP